MCGFFSLISDGKGRAYWFDREVRKQIIAGKIDYALDGHSSIADYYGFEGEEEDKMNKYEYNPLLKRFKVDQLNTTDDSKQIKKFCENLDFKRVVPELIIKPIVHPFQKNRKRIIKKDVELLKKCASIRGSVWASIRGSVWNSVGISVVNSIQESIRNSVEAPIRDSVRTWVKDSIWAPIRDSIWDVMGAYTLSFFKLKKNPFQPYVDLWERGLLTSFDGETWRLHGGRGKILWEGRL